MPEHEPYELALLIIGAGMLLSVWLPQLIFRRGSTFAVVPLAIGALLFGLHPSLEVPSPFGGTGQILWEKLTEAVVVISLVGAGLRINRRGKCHWRSTLGLLVVAMPLTIAAVALLGYWAGLPLGAALLLGAVLAPTDPVLASDVQAESPDKEEHNIRFTLTSEAGLNDGLAFPFTYLAIAVAAAGGMSGQLLADWALWELLGKCVIGAAIGIGVGWMLGKVLYRFPKGATLAGTGLGSLALVVFLVAYGLTEVVGGYGFIAAFLAAMVLRREDYDHEYNVDLADFADYIEHAAIAVLLVLIGGSMVSAWQDLTWSMMGACLALILVVRPVVGWVSLIGSRYNKAHRAVIAIYGVRGIGTLYYLAYAFGKHHFEQAPEIWAAGLFALAVSAVLHGLTAMPVMQRIAGDDTTSLKPEEDSA